MLVDLYGRFPWLIVIGAFSLGVLVGMKLNQIKQEHYNRNQNQDEYFSQFKTDEEMIKMVELEEDGWIAADSDLNKYHRYTNGEHGNEAIYNVKYLKKLDNGASYEVIICEPSGTDYIVRDPKNAGTYNYCSPDGLWGTLDHAILDVIPYYLWGNTSDDGLTIIEKIIGNDKEEETVPDNKD